eukprot:m.22188 g.22188  ORF g.22188 m.22188 type:complete len:84 (-) comp9267_c0_seq1:267-518(-)
MIASALLLYGSRRENGQVWAGILLQYYASAHGAPFSPRLFVGYWSSYKPLLLQKLTYKTHEDWICRFSQPIEHIALDKGTRLR